MAFLKEKEKGMIVVQVKREDIYDSTPHGKPIIQKVHNRADMSQCQSVVNA
jgi:hypothetical protein